MKKKFTMIFVTIVTMFALLFGAGAGVLAASYIDWGNGTVQYRQSKHKLEEVKNRVQNQTATIKNLKAEVKILENQIKDDFVSKREYGKLEMDYRGVLEELRVLKNEYKEYTDMLEQATADMIDINDISSEILTLFE